MRRLLAILVFTALLALLPTAHASAQATTCKGVLYAPAIDLIACVVNAPIVERRYVVPVSDVGHLAETAWLSDDRWRIVLAGHTPGIFGRVTELAVSDVLWLVDAERAEQYRVTWIDETTPDDLSWLMPTESETLTLITCAQGIERRRIVHAVRVY